MSFPYPGVFFECELLPLCLRGKKSGEMDRDSLAYFDVRAQRLAHANHRQNIEKILESSLDPSATMRHHISCHVPDFIESIR